MVTDHSAGLHPGMQARHPLQSCPTEERDEEEKEGDEKEEKADRKYAKDGVFVYEKDFLVGDQIELKRAETDKGPITLDGIKSGEVTLTSSLGEHGVTVTMGKMDTFTCWTTLNKWAQFICLEPMLSFGDTKREFDISRMKETRLLKRGESENYTNEFIVF